MDKRLIWFGNDADGLSVIDVLAVGTFILYIISKLIHIILSTIFQDKLEFIGQLNLIMEDTYKSMNIIILFYFGKKTLDTVVTKIGLFKSNQYNNFNNSISDDNTKNNKGGTNNES